MIQPDMYKGWIGMRGCQVKENRETKELLPAMAMQEMVLLLSFLCVCGLVSVLLSFFEDEQEKSKRKAIACH